MHIIHSWDEVTLAQFNAIQQLGKEYDGEQFVRRVIEVLYNQDPEEIPIVHYLSMTAGLQKMTSEPIKANKLTSDASYTINGVRYVLDLNPSSFTMAQYTDFTSFANNGGNIVDMISAVLIPEGCKYNEGYDMEKAKADIGSLPVSNAFGISNFFLRSSKRYTKVILRSLTSQMNLTKEKKKELEKELEALSHALDRFLSC